jgi:hypothetical protein
MPDYKKIRGLIDYAEANPEEHDQRVWGKKNTCGSAFCIAGLACAQEPGVALIWWGDGLDYVLLNGRDYSPSVAARKILGLSGEQGTWLFQADNSIPYMRQLVDCWEAEEKEDG